MVDRNDRKLVLLLVVMDDCTIWYTYIRVLFSVSLLIAEFSICNILIQILNKYGRKNLETITPTALVLMLFC